MQTMIEGFQNLDREELDALVVAPILIVILVGAADGELDREERTWSERLLQSRTYNTPKALNEYYRAVVDGFEAKLQSEMTHLPKDAAARNEVLAQRLDQLNPVLARLEVELAAELYKGFLALAEETAKASGGFLRIGGISAEESKWVRLPMLTPIVSTKKNKEGEPEEDDAW